MQNIVRPPFKPLDKMLAVLSGCEFTVRDLSLFAFSGRCKNIARWWISKVNFNEYFHLVSGRFVT